MAESAEKGIPLRPPSRRVSRQLPEDFGIVPVGDRPQLPISDRRFAEEGIGSLTLARATQEQIGFDEQADAVDSRAEQHGYL